MSSIRIELKYEYNLRELVDEVRKGLGGYPCWSRDGCNLRDDVALQQVALLNDRKLREIKKVVAITKEGDEDRPLYIYFRANIPKFVTIHIEADFDSILKLFVK